MGDIICKKQSCIVFLKNENDGSSYYRLYQYLKDCRIVNMIPSAVYRFYYGSRSNHDKIKKVIMGVITLINVCCSIIIDSLIWKSKVIIINRRFFPRKCPRILEIILKRYLDKRKVYWDFDDNIFFDGEISKREATLLEMESECIIVTNNYLLNTISEPYRNKVVLLPTTDCEFENIDIDKSISKRSSKFNEEIVICWVGTMNNLKYLSSIIQELDEAANYCINNLKKKLTLKVVANKRVDASTEYLNIENIEWTRQRAASVMEESHIGLMPLSDNEYTRGKGGFKAIQYMSAGVVPLLSDVGYNTSVVVDGESGYFCRSHNDWKEKIILISSDVELWQRMVKCARIGWIEKFNPKMVRDFWNHVIEEDI